MQILNIRTILPSTNSRNFGNLAVVGRPVNKRRQHTDNIRIFRAWSNFQYNHLSPADIIRGTAHVIDLVVESRPTLDCRSARLAERMLRQHALIKAARWRELFGASGIRSRYNVDAQPIGWVRRRCGG